MVSFNKITRKIHLWLGLTCGLITSFSGITGSLYVWQPEISAMLNPDLLKVENIERVKDSSILRSTATLIETHKDSINKAFLPYREQQTISILYSNGKTLYYHPETKILLGEKSASITFFENLLQLHRTLGFPKIGKYIIGTSALIFCFLLLTSGFFIWWKAYGRNLSKGFKIKWKSKKKRFNLDLHKVLGIYFLIPLFVMAFTGAYFTYYTTYKNIFSVFNASKNNQNSQALREKKQTFDQLLLTKDTQYALRAIYFPLDDKGNYKFRYIENWAIRGGLRKTKEVSLDQTGKTSTLSDFKIDSVSNRITAQFYPIHTGEIIGLFGRIIVFISGLIPFILLSTGYKIYKLKYKNK